MLRQARWGRRGVPGRRGVGGDAAGRGGLRGGGGAGSLEAALDHLPSVCSGAGGTVAAE